MTLSIADAIRIVNDAGCPDIIDAYPQVKQVMLLAYEAGVVAERGGLSTGAMTRDDILRMAEEARLGYRIPGRGELPGTWVGTDLIVLERFAVLVAERANEALRTAQIQKEELKVRIARVGLDGNIAKAKAVAAEREACAKVCEARADAVAYGANGSLAEEYSEAIECAEAIRARRAAPELRPNRADCPDSPNVAPSDQLIETQVKPDGTPS